MIGVVRLVSVLFLGGCEVHQWPELDYRDAVFTLHLDFAAEMPLYREIIYTRAGSDTYVLNGSREEQPPHDIRYTVKIYRTDAVSREMRADAETLIFTRPYSSNLNHTVELTLDEGAYTFYVWADYVDAGTNTDKYYDTSDFGAVTLANRTEHAGSNDFRDAFCGSATATVVHPDRYMGTDIVPDNEATVAMVRPMGRYEFVSTDVDLFFSRLATLRNQNTRQSDDEDADGDTDSVPSDATRSIDLNDFCVVLSYNAYMPSIFNIFTNKPADSWTGVSYVSGMELTDEGLSLGFDYVFVNGLETLMNIRLDVYTKEGELIASTPSVEVPIVRSKLTLVKGEFLTAYSSGGVTVNPDFEGPDFNIELY